MRYSRWLKKREPYVEFEAVVMRDTLTWRSPLGQLGVVADKLVIERHMRTYVARKQSLLKALAERTTDGTG